MINGEGINGKKVTHVRTHTTIDSAGSGEILSNVSTEISQFEKNRHMLNFIFRILEG